MSTKFNTNKNNSPSRINANKSPRKTGYFKKVFEKFPLGYGKNSPRFGILDYPYQRYS
tara:strand:- start:327 stop:500 length:174 start_codon:yes stop_codon:yes gene_type:complete